ncbi:dinucleotide-binding protein [Paractinoplanes abujensis]|uniref:Putative dinucleotide-binding enzyme n=1 Tax=Paractinoplanes abujensis TaxID=882441 RepID=A0A7W7CNY3_9ACTN|nr:diguanylate cyclase [Actinoplanes abujensis]MBB4692039.1 putative dinucleotide-binding enzyme [Actinoplanes abujensis]GID16544.1 dinucleotide-binding protein [Actinoplanes abujensis]
MANISILGTGNMGQAIGGLVAKGGNTVQQLNTSGADQPVTGDIVILAVPHAALADIVATRGAQLAGKVVVDITNPVDFATFDDLTVPADGSAAAELARALPQSQVVKAFNTNFAGTLATGSVGAETTAVLIAGDDAGAKAALSEVVTAAGLRAVDAGSLKRARELESLAFLQMTLAAGEKLSWNGGFAAVA